MIRRSINLLGVAALLFASGGCTSSGGSAPWSVASVQQALANGCNYELLASTAATDIAAVASTIAPGPAAIAVTAAQIANAICKSVTAVPAPAPSVGRMGVPVHGGFLSAGAPVSVNGVMVHGAFVK